MNASDQAALEGIIGDPKRTIGQGVAGRFGNVTDVYSSSDRGVLAAG